MADPSDRFHFAAMTWSEVEETLGHDAMALLPVGAIEAHGRHLPLETDTIISVETATRAARKLLDQGKRAFVLPPLSYAVASCAVEFAGTLSISPETAGGMMCDIARALALGGVKRICIVNNHFDPGHVAVLRETVREIEERGWIDIRFPDVTRHELAGRLTDEFRAASCHAGRYETSLILAVRPDLVRRDVMERAKANPVNMVKQIQDGAGTFCAMGMKDAYCGDPSAASAEEGDTTYGVLSDIIVEACLA